MKKQRLNFHTAVIALAALLTVLFVFAAAVPAILALTAKSGADTRAETADRKVYDPNTEGAILRLHVIANSDGEEDQRVKLAVRDAVLDYERGRRDLLGTENAQQAENALLSDGGGLLETVRGALRAEGCDYDAQLVLGDFEFPDREYGGELYPAGTYRALRIILGNGGGRNWWCIMFPPLCIVNDRAGEAAEPAYPIRFDSLLVRLFGFITGREK